jgi:hypothetical protein
MSVDSEPRPRDGEAIFTCGHPWTAEPYWYLLDKAVRCQGHGALRWIVVCAACFRRHAPDRIPECVRSIGTWKTDEIAALPRLSE